MGGKFWMGFGAFLILVVGVIYSFAAPGLKLIQFDDIKPAGFNLEECWNGTGMDHNQNVYIGISDVHTVSGYNDSDDVAIFRYNAKTGQRQFLNTLKGICGANGNLGPNQYWPKKESIAKIHSQFTEHNGKMYFSSHDYHNLTANYSDTIYHRGGHFFSYDLATGQFEDLSKTDPNGVSVRYQGIISMAVLKAHNKLAGYTFPWGDILIYDLTTRKTTFYRAPAEFRIVGNKASREIIATNKGKVFFSYSAANAPLYELNALTGAMKRTAYTLHNGFIPSLMMTANGRYAYFNNMDGYLMAFDAENETLENIGFCVPDSMVSAGRTPTYVHCGMSRDETKLYSIVMAWKNNVGTPYDAYEYDIRTKTKRLMGNLKSFLSAGSVISGSGMADSLGRVYFSRFHGAESCGLIQVGLGQASGISFIQPGNLRTVTKSNGQAELSVIDLLGRRIWADQKSENSLNPLKLPSSPYLLIGPNSNRGQKKQVSIK